MENITMPKKPETLVYTETQYEIFNFISKIIADTKIPFYQLEIIINKLANEVSEYADKERETAVAEYRAAMEAYTKAVNATKEEKEDGVEEPAPSDNPIDTTTAETTEE